MYSSYSFFLFAAARCFFTSVADRVFVRTFLSSLRSSNESSVVSCSAERPSRASVVKEKLGLYAAFVV